MKVVRYSKDIKAQWDKFVNESCNGTFLFQRNFMDYHSDRFKDHSVVVYNNDIIIGILPANEEGDEIYSHAGLTFGGLVISSEQRLGDIVWCFKAILEYYNSLGLSKLYYKQIPYYYYTMPSFADEYVLFLLNAKLYRRDASFLLEEGKGLKLQKGKKSNISKAKKEGVLITQSNDYSIFWDEVLAPNLLKSHNVKPVHTKGEIEMLASKFPGNIKLHIAAINNEIVAGTVLFLNSIAVNVQYISANEKGKNAGALDCLFDNLLDQYNDYRFFNFGIANEQEGRYLNQGLAQWKEGFGARAVSHNFYEIDTKNYLLLEKYVS